MTTPDYTETLTRKHHELELKLAEAYVHYLPDSRILELKKRKLALKDAITRMQASRRRAAA